MGRFLVKDFGIMYVKKSQPDNFASGSGRFGRVALLENAYKAVAQAEKLRVRPRRILAPVEEREKNGEKRMYCMNKTKVRRKAFAYALLQRSMRFLAFYSVSFPQGLSDEACMRIWNKVLTRWRRDLNLKSYLWVRERQKNGTMHYHMLTNDFMYVSEANRVVAASIEYEIKKYGGSWGNSCMEKYNGVDVKRIVSMRDGRGYKSTRTVLIRVAKYLTKYITKEDGYETFRLWHCSRLVSALVISADVSEADVREAVEEEEKRGCKVKFIEHELCGLIFLSVVDKAFFRETVIRINNAIDHFFENNHLY